MRKAKLIIELDGSQHHEPNHQEKDALRDAELNSLGFTVMRFNNDEVMREIEAVVEQIYLFLENVGLIEYEVGLTSAKSPLPLFAKEGNS